MKKIIKNISFLLFLITVISIGMVSCEDDNTGYSTLVPTSPTITITPESSNTVLTEDDSKHKVTVSMSEAQIADVKLYIKQVGGTADASDYNVPGSLVIPVGSTSGSFEIQILSDEIKEDTETLTLQVGDSKTANATLTPVNVEFEIHNLTAGDLTVGLSWETDVASAVGLDLDPTEAVDMRLLLIDSNGEIVDGSDGASFEELVLSGDELEDGEYIIATDIYSTIDAGDFNALLNIDLEVHFFQVGLLDTTISLPQAMTNQFACDSYRTNLGIVTKAGSTYTITEALSSSWQAELESLVGSWKGTDSDYPSHTVTTINDGKLQITGLAYEWISDFWGEEVLNMVSVDIDINWNSSGEFTIPEQYYMTTLYDGDEYPYDITGSGVIITCGDSPMITITYELFQDGFSPSEWAYENGYMDSPKFTATLTMDPDGLQTVGALKSTRTISSNILINKPTH